MTLIELYITVVGVITLRLLIQDNFTYLMASGALGLTLGMFRGLSK